MQGTLRFGKCQRGTESIGSEPVPPKLKSQTCIPPSSPPPPSFRSSPIVLNILELEQDQRPHAEVTICDQMLVGLLDTGSTCTILGKNSEAFVKILGLKISSSSGNVKTADGTGHRIVGYVNVPIKYKNQVESMNILLIPSLTRELILGWDFWQMFKVRPHMCESTQLHVGSIQENAHDLSVEEIQVLSLAISEFAGSVEGQIGRTNLLMHNIDTEGVIPIKQRQYPISPYMQEEMYPELDRMLSLGVIEPSESPWSNPLIMVKKANGKPRLCLDSRKLNAVTKKDAFPLPHISRILGRLNGTKFLSAIDLSDAFWQVPLTDSAKEKTAFVAPGRGLFQFTRMPFGLHNAPQTLSRLMDRVLGIDLEPSVFVYLDDIIVMSATFTEHMSLLKEVARRLKKAGLTISHAKSKFCLKRLKYLGYIVSETGLSPDPDKLQGIYNYVVPRNITETRRLLGMAGWYRRFIPDFASIVAPITDLLKKTVKFHWTDEAQAAFEKIKVVLSTKPVLANPNFNEHFYIHADSSGVGMGAVLCQGKEDEQRIIASMSQKFSSAQKKYTVTEQECLAVLTAIYKFRPYIEGVHFTIITDHASLLWLQNLKDPAGRLARWALRLQQFDYTMVHRKGKYHIVPDALSRAIESLELGNVLKPDIEYEDLVKRVRARPEMYPLFRVVDDKLFRQNRNHLEDDDDWDGWRLFVPLAQRVEVLKENHDDKLSAHQGVTRTIEKVQRRYFWPGMRGDIKAYVSSCEVCIANKPNNELIRPVMGAQANYMRPWQALSIDFIGPLPLSKKRNQYILMVMDWFTKFVFFQPIKTADSKEVISFLEERVFLVFGVPQYIISDNGKQFVSRTYKDFLSAYGVESRLTAVYSPQANPIERVNRVLITAIRSYIGTCHTNWDSDLAKLGCALRNMLHQSTGVTAYRANFGRDIITCGYNFNDLNTLGTGQNSELEGSTSKLTHRLDKIHKSMSFYLQKAYERNQKQYNKKATDIEYETGETVWRRNFVQSHSGKRFAKKLAPKFVKALVIERKGLNLYILKDFDGKGEGTFHAKDIKKAYKGALRGK